MKFVLLLLIIVFFLTLAYTVNAENEQVSGSTLLNFSIYEIISTDTVLVTVNVTANSTVSINATNTTSTSLDFVSNTSLGNISITITRHPTCPVDVNLSSLNAVGLKYVNMSANNTFNSSILTWKLIKIHYTNAELDAVGVVEDSLGIYWYNTSTSQWIELTTSLDQVFDTGVNTTANYVWANSTLFSLYTIGGLKANDQTCLANAECFSNVCCSGTCQSSCTTTATTAPAGGGGAGGSTGAPSVITEISNFTIDKDFIQILLKPSEIKKRLINISNTGNTNLTITVNLKNLEDFLVFPGGVSEYTFYLNKGETRSIQLLFFTSEKQELGVFPGNIVVTGDGIEKPITIVIEIESIELLFDIDVEIPQRYKEILPGEEVLVQLTIYNVKATERVDVDVVYGLKDFEGNIIVSENETLAVEMQVSIVRSLDIPFDVKPGNYVVYAEVKYDDIVGIGTDILKVTKKEIGIKTIVILSLLVITGVMILIFFLTIRFIEKKLKKSSRYKRKVKL